MESISKDRRQKKNILGKLKKISPMALFVLLLLVGLGAFFVFKAIRANNVDPYASNSPVSIYPLQNNYTGKYPEIDTTDIMVDTSVPESMRLVKVTPNNSLTPSVSMVNKFKDLFSDSKLIDENELMQLSWDQNLLVYATDERVFDISITQTGVEKRDLPDIAQSKEISLEYFKGLGLEGAIDAENTEYSLTYLRSYGYDLVNSNGLENADHVKFSAIPTVNSYQVRGPFDRGFLEVIINKTWSPIKVLYTYFDLNESEVLYPLKDIEQVLSEARGGYAYVFVENSRVGSQNVTQANLTSLSIYYYFDQRNAELIPVFGLRGVDENGNGVELVVPAIENRFINYIY